MDSVNNISKAQDMQESDLGQCTSDSINSSETSEIPVQDILSGPFTLKNSTKQKAAFMPESREKSSKHEPAFVPGTSKNSTPSSGSAPPVKSNTRKLTLTTKTPEELHRKSKCAGPTKLNQTSLLKRLKSKKSSQQSTDSSESLQEKVPLSTIDKSFIKTKVIIKQQREKQAARPSVLEQQKVRACNVNNPTKTCATPHTVPKLVEVVAERPVTILSGSKDVEKHSCSKSGAAQTPNYQKPQFAPHRNDYFRKVVGAAANSPSALRDAGKKNSTRILESSSVTGGVKTGNIQNAQYIYNITDHESKSDSVPAMPENDGSILEKELKSTYSRLTLPNLPWMHVGKLDIGSKYVELDLINNVNCTKLEHIFGRPVDARVKINNIDECGERILIESPFGYGKTTLSYKIAYDWASEADYTKQFKFTFLLPLKTVKNSVHEELFKNAKNFDPTLSDNADVEKMLNRFSKGTLLILDGFEETSTHLRHDVIKILNKKQFKDATVIVTCRSGEYHLTSNEQLALASNDFHVTTEFWGKKLEISGLQHRNQMLMLEKLIDDDSKRYVLNRIEKLINPVRDIFKCPLCLVLLALIVDKDDLVSVKNVTELYKRLVNFVIRRSLHKQNPKLSVNLDLFKIDKVNDSEREIEEKFSVFGKLAIKKILLGNLEFECVDKPDNNERGDEVNENKSVETEPRVIETLEKKRDGVTADNITSDEGITENSIADEIYKFGFLIKHVTPKQLHTRYHYEIFHLTFLEFFAAFSIWIDYKRNRDRLTNKQISEIYLIFSLFTKKKNLSQILPFLVGLLKDNASSLFNRLDMYSMYKYNSTIKPEIEFMLRDCEVNFDLFESLCNLFPPVPGPSINVWLKQCLDKTRNLFTVKVNTIVHIHEDMLKKLPQHLQDELIPTECSEVMAIVGGANNIDKIRCNKLDFLFTTVEDKCSESDMYFGLWHASSAIEKFLLLNNKPNLQVVLKYIRIDLSKNPVNELTYFVTHDQVASDLTKFVIEHNRLEKLHLNISKSEDDVAAKDNYVPGLFSIYLQPLGLVDGDSNCLLTVDTNKIKRCVIC